MKDRRVDESGGAHIDHADEDEPVSLLDLAVPLAERWKLVVFGSLAAGLVAYGAAFMMPPTYTATTTFLPPQQQQSSTSALVSTLGSLAGLAGSAGNLRTPADQYVALMQSTNVFDRIVDQFKLMEVYEKKYRVDARNHLGDKVHISIGKKDGLITVGVDDESPQRAADMANRFVDELRRMTDTIAVSEAQQRRKFFELQLKQTQEKLVRAQQALQASGFTQGALKAEPRSAAEGYARLRAEVTAAEVRLQTLRSSLSDSAPEVQQQSVALGALRSQLSRLEQTEVQGGPDYVGKYREFKYQETLFEIFAKQYELARVDESREGGLIQVVDPATPPERRSKPKRLVIALVATLAAAVALLGGLLINAAWRAASNEPGTAHRMARLRRALGRD